MEKTTPSFRRAADRQVISITGADAQRFLQDLVSNDIGGGGLTYAALLSAQGKYLFDFLIWQEREAFLIDIAASRAQAFAQRLSMYKLRADVQITADPREVVQVFGRAPDGGLRDPRHEALGWRCYGPCDLQGLEEMPDAAWDALRVAHVIPETGAELVPDETYILEAGFERLGGVDFRKGCYVGQEVTARMKHKTELKKGLVRVEIEGSAPPSGTEILAGEKVAGTLYTTSGAQGLAHLRFDRAAGEMQAGAARIRRCAPDP